MKIYRSGSHSSLAVSGPVLFSEQKRHATPTDELKSIDVVGLLRWVYSDQKADKISTAMMADDEAVGFAGGGSAFDQLESLGVLVRGGGFAGSDLHPDALAIHEAVCAYAAEGKEQAERAGMVVLYARAGFEPGVKSAEPGFRVVNARSTSYWSGKKELSFIPSTNVKKPMGYEGPSYKRGQASDILLVKKDDSHANELKVWTIWGCGLEEIYDRIPALECWKLRPFKLPDFVKGEEK